MKKHFFLPERHAAQDHPSSDQCSILQALDAARAALIEVGGNRVELITVTGRDRVSIQPTHLADGEKIAQALGLNSPLDHRMVEPGYTLWSGTREGLEFQVRSTLRQPIGALI